MEGMYRWHSKIRQERIILCLMQQFRNRNFVQTTWVMRVVHIWYATTIRGDLTAFS